MSKKEYLSRLVNLKLIHTFLLVAEHRSFREAALTAGRSQSAISAQIKQLETQLGVTLIIRTTRSLQMTPEGELLLEQARQAIDDIEFGLRSITEATELRKGKVTMACSLAFAATRLPGILASFKKEYPGVQINVNEHKSGELLACVRSGEVDFGVGPQVYDDMLEYDVLWSEPLLALAPKDMVPDTADTIDLARIAALPLIMYHANTVTVKILQDGAKAQGITLNTQYRCIQGQTLVALAEAGLGVAVVTGSGADLRNLRHTRALRIVEPAMERNFALIRCRSRRLAPAPQRLYDLINRHCGKAQ